MKKYLVIERREEMDKGGFTYHIKSFDTIGEAYRYFIEDMSRRTIARTIEADIVERKV